MSVRNAKLYYRGNKINDMRVEETNCYHIMYPAEYFELLAPGDNDPEDPPLVIYPEQTRETLHGPRSGSQHLVEGYDRDIKWEIGTYRWRNWE